MKYFFTLVTLVFSAFFSASLAFAQTEEQAAPKVPKTCYLRTQYTYTSYNNYCTYYDDVMVGIQKLDPLAIRCARMIVDCPGFDIKLEKK